jgi:hypothetical protein
MDNTVTNVIKKFEALGEVEVKNRLKATNDPSAETKKLETFFKNSEETFKKENGRQMTYSEMRDMFG